MIYLAHYNYDYNESMHSARDLRQVLEDIQASFDVEVEITDASFADEVDHIYSEGNWKGFTVHVLDPESAALIELDLKEASAALRSNHAMIRFEGKLRKSFEAIRKKQASRAA